MEPSSSSISVVVSRSRKVLMFCSEPMPTPSPSSSLAVMMMMMKRPTKPSVSWPRPLVRVPDHQRKLSALHRLPLMMKLKLCEKPDLRRNRPGSEDGLRFLLKPERPGSSERKAAGRWKRRIFPTALKRLCSLPSENLLETSRDVQQVG